MSAHLDAVLGRDELASLDAPARRLALRRIMRDRGALDELHRIVDRIDGYGALSSLMREPGVTDILVNGPDEIWVERNGALALTDLRFDDADDLLLFIERMLGRAGRRADAGHPIEDASLPDGSRLHVVMPPLAGDQPVVSIRRFSPALWDLSALVELGAMTDGDATSLEELVRGRATILVAGPTGSGKTTLLNALLAAVPAPERVVTIEETRELARRQGHHVALVARPANADGAGAVGLDRLLRAALRMRPDRIVVGEVRGAEASIAVDALSTGHTGGMLTIHAEDAPGALNRLRHLAAVERPTGWTHDQVATAIDAVVVMQRVAGARKVRGVVTR